MKTIGTYLQEYRQRAELSIDDISKRTKIRHDYLVALEADDFGHLPSIAFVKGFIRSYSIAVKADPEKALAVFRRDFDPNTQGKVVPRGIADPISQLHRFWNPATTTLVAITLVASMLAIYVISQLITLNAAPQLTVAQPESGVEVLNNTLLVSGKTQSDAQVRVNNQPVIVGLDGNFETVLNLSPGTHIIVIEAESRDGKISQTSRQVTVLSN